MDRYPEFLEHFHKLVARSQNALRGRWENFCSSEQACVVKLVGRDAVIDKLVYTATNPVLEDLVDRVRHWPGVNGLAALLNGRTLRATRLLHFFRRDGAMPEELELAVTLPPELGPAGDVLAELGERVRAVEDERAAERQRTGCRVLGRRRCSRSRGAIARRRGSRGGTCGRRLPREASGRGSRAGDGALRIIADLRCDTIALMAHVSPHASSLLLLAALGCGSVKSMPPASDLSFLRAQGTTIVDRDGSPVFLKGISLGNEVWSHVALPGDHSEIDFRRLAAMGANSTRFLLNYRTFEDDAAPGVYKAAGWRWIDQNIAWAQANGIYLILNMHVPQGGFQSNGEGGALWSDAANQDRLTALWTAIASHYAEEPTIAGFGLVNEPQPLVDRRQWRDLATRLARAIRSVDGNHILFVERPIAVAGDFTLDADLNLFTIDDPNVVYEFHFYEPSEYAFQLQPWNDTPDGGGYPDPDKVIGVTERWIDLATFDAPAAPVGTSGWTYYEGTRITATDANIAAGRPTLEGRAIGGGTIAFDDLTIKEFDPNGTFTRSIARILPKSTSGWYFWSSDGTGTGTTTASCKTSATCLTITATAADANYGGTAYYFAPRQGYQYSLSGWMRGIDIPAGATARLRLDLVGSSTPVTTRNKAALAQTMTRHVAWGAAHAVPLFLGEFGVYKACFANGKGGLSWVGDVYDLATAGAPRVAALSYHQYHEDAFALYYGTGPVDPAHANQPLIDLLTSKLHAAP